MLKVKETGIEIVGTYDLVYCVCRVVDAKRSGKELDLEFDGSNILWDTQKTVRTEKGERKFIGEDDKVYLESEIELEE